MVGKHVSADTKRDMKAHNTDFRGVVSELKAGKDDTGFFEPVRPHAPEDATNLGGQTMPLNGLGSSSVSPLTLRKAKTMTDVSTLRNLGRIHNGRTFRQEYKIEYRLAAGAFGVTYVATEICSGRRVVVKQPKDAKDTSDFERTVDKTSPYIVRTFEIFTDRAETFVVMEFCAGGNLFNAVWELYQKEGFVDKVWCARVFKQVLQGLHYLHEQFRESHNDVKPENILLEHVPSGSRDAPRTMIADFGCASGNPHKAASGDPRYLAPEILKAARRAANGDRSAWDMDFPMGADTWSAGVTLFEILTGVLPFINQPNVSGWANFAKAQGGALEQNLRRKQHLMITGQLEEADCSRLKDKKASDLVRNMLQVDPDKLSPSRRHANTNGCRIIGTRKEALSLWTMRCVRRM